jgi:mono/diheme cytochrome c family protein
MALSRSLLQASLTLICFVFGPGFTTGQERAESSAQPADETLVRGGTLYKIHCASCHGKGGVGDGPVASALRKKPADLTKIAKRAGGKFPEERVRSTIDGRTELAAHGAREMPVWGLSFADPGRDVSSEREIEAEIRALLRYVASLQKP